MKIYGNINFFYFLIKNLSLLGPHRRKILALKAAGKKEEERQAIYEVCNYFVDKVMKKLNWKMNIINPENFVIQVKLSAKDKIKKIIGIFNSPQNR